MNVITAPVVELLARQELLSANLDKWLAANGLEWDRDETDGSPGEVIAEASGRVCYLSYKNPRPGGNAGYLGHIKEVGHGSVLEHVVYTFFIGGVSRSLTHELVRHRVGVAYSQLSQRYVDARETHFVCPSIIFRHPDRLAVWTRQVKEARATYEELSDWITADLADPSWAANWLPPDATATDRRKAARQAARSVLPNATETKLSFTANARALRHIFDMRAKFAAEPEIRVLAHSLWGIVVKDSPHLFGDYRPVPLPDGSFALETNTPGV